MPDRPSHTIPCSANAKTLGFLRPIYMIGFTAIVPSISPTQYVTLNLRALGFSTFHTNLLVIPYQVLAGWSCSFSPTTVPRQQIRKGARRLFSTDNSMTSDHNDDLTLDCRTNGPALALGSLGPSLDPSIFDLVKSGRYYHRLSMDGVGSNNSPDEPTAM